MGSGIQHGIHIITENYWSYGPRLCTPCKEFCGRPWFYVYILCTSYYGIFFLYFCAVFVSFPILSLQCKFRIRLMAANCNMSIKFSSCLARNRWHDNCLISPRTRPVFTHVTFRAALFDYLSHTPHVDALKIALILHVKPAKASAYLLSWTCIKWMTGICKTGSWQMTDDIAGVEFARLENDGLQIWVSKRTHPYESTTNKIPYSRGSPEVPMN